MRFDEDHESPDLIDRRGERSGGGGSGLGFLAFLPFVRARWGWGGVLVMLAVVGVGSYLTRTPSEAVPASPTSHAGDVRATKGADPARHFVAFVLDDNQKVWRERLAARNRPYENAKLVLYTDSTPTGCGYGAAATGPFYCPRDQRVYLDLGFFDDLGKRFGARGDFAQAYVIAHEIGHHVQHQLGGIEGKKSLGATGGSVRVELQADCYAGIWAHDTNQRNLLDEGDVGEAMTAAGSVGDDRLQKAASGTVRPDSFSHGTSAQRQRWFRVGFERASLEACDTFAASSL